MKNKTSLSQKIGWAVFILGSLYMFGLGWAQSWQIVPAINQSGFESFHSPVLGLIWGLSAPLGAFIVLLGAALIAKVGPRRFGLLVLLLFLFTAWRIMGTTRHMISALFGIGGGLITVFFLGSAWRWAKSRPALPAAEKTGSDLRMLGLVFFVVSAWDLCGIFGVGNFVLRPELAQKFEVPLSSTIDAASGVMILLILGWGFSFFGQLLSRRARTAVPAIEQITQAASAD